MFVYVSYLFVFYIYFVICELSVVRIRNKHILFHAHYIRIIYTNQLTYNVSVYIYHISFTYHCPHDVSTTPHDVWAYIIIRILVFILLSSVMFTSPYRHSIQLCYFLMFLCLKSLTVPCKIICCHTICSRPLNRCLYYLIFRFSPLLIRYH